jgi:hypothetical protein
MRQLVGRNREEGLGALPQDGDCGEDEKGAKPPPTPAPPREGEGFGQDEALTPVMG